MFGGFGGHARGGDQVSPQRAPEEPRHGWQRHSEEDRTRRTARGGSEVGTCGATGTLAPVRAHVYVRRCHDWSVTTVDATSRTSTTFFFFQVKTVTLKEEQEFLGGT